jgi:hypothetical protein
MPVILTMREDCRISAHPVGDLMENVVQQRIELSRVYLQRPDKVD